MVFVRVLADQILDHLKLLVFDSQVKARVLEPMGCLFLVVATFELDQASGRGAVKLVHEDLRVQLRFVVSLGEAAFGIFLLAELGMVRI